MGQVEALLHRGIDRIAAKQLQGKITVASHNTVSLRLEAGEVKQAAGSDLSRYSIEVLSHGKIGQTRGNREDEVLPMIDRAVTLAGVGRDAYFSEWPKPEKQAPVRLWSDTTSKITIEDLKEALDTCSDIIKTYDQDLYIEGEARHNSSTSNLATTGGVNFTEKRHDWTLWVMAQRTKSDDILMTWEGRRWGDRNDYFDPEIIAAEIIGNIEMAESTAAVISGEYEILLHPYLTGWFLEPLALGINGLNVAKGSSPLAGRIGERILSDTITITDDPHVDFSPGARALDVDGIPTRRQALFHRGVLERYLYDLNTAGLTGTEPTGNTECYPYYPVMEKGDIDLEDLISGIDRGIYIKGLLGFGQSNIINGDYSSNIDLGYLIEKGKLKGRIKNAMLSGNVYDQLADGVILSKDTDYTGALPYLLFHRGVVAAG